jgi:hypothetical protein
VLEPVPPDIAALVSDDEWFARAEKWVDGAENRDEREVVLSGDGLVPEPGTRYDVSRKRPLFHFWRTEEDVSVRWEPTGKNPEGVWSIREGQFTIYGWMDTLGAMPKRALLSLMRCETVAS